MTSTLPLSTLVGALSSLLTPTLYLKDNKGVIRFRKSKKDRQHNDQKKKDRQHNDQKKKDQTTQ